MFIGAVRTTCSDPCRRMSATKRTEGLYRVDWSLSCTAAAWTSTPSLPRSVTSTERHYERSCVNAWEEECAIFAPTCADGLSGQKQLAVSRQQANADGRTSAMSGHLPAD